MKQIDPIDSLKHLNFPDSTKKEKREKFGSFLLAVFGLLGLLAMSNPSFHYAKTDATDSEAVNKFWLTPASLNAEKTALNSITIPSSTTVQYYSSAKAAATKQLN